MKAAKPLEPEYPPERLAYRAICAITSEGSIQSGTVSLPATKSVASFTADLRDREFGARISGRNGADLRNGWEVPDEGARGCRPSDAITPQIGLRPSPSTGSFSGVLPRLR